MSTIDDPQAISTVTVDAGSWPPTGSEIYLERTALPFLGVTTGQQIQVRAPGGPVVPMTVAGSVHDAGVAPAAQERTAYGHVTISAIAALGQDAALNELKIVVGDSNGASSDPAFIAATSQAVAAALSARGSTVTGIDIPPPLRHPHYGQMVTVSLMLLSFGVIALLLSSILVATMLGGLLTAQIRQIGSMNAVGARTGQILAMYMSLTAAIAVVATAIALVPGFALGRVLAEQAAALLNLDITSPNAPAWVVDVVLLAGIGVPLIVALIPLTRASRWTVREAIDEHGRDPGRVADAAGSRLARIPRAGRMEVVAARSLMRRPGRLALTVGLLAVAGAAFLTGLNGASGWELASSVATGLDVEVRLDGQPTRTCSPAARCREWSARGMDRARPSRTPASSTWRTSTDDSHGDRPATPLITLPLQGGRWLKRGDQGSIVLNTLATAAQIPGEMVGDRVTLTMNQQPTRWTVVGIVSTSARRRPPTSPIGVRGTRAGGPASMSASSRRADAAGRRAVLDRLEGALDAGGFAVDAGFTTDDRRSALDGHVFVLIEALLAIAILIGFVGLLGLGSAVSTSVTERTREFAVMNAIGATAQAIRRIVSTEGILTGVAGLAVAAVISLPLTAAFGSFLGNTAFRQPLPSP